MWDTMAENAKTDLIALRQLAEQNDYNYRWDLISHEEWEITNSRIISKLELYEVIHGTNVE